MTAAMTASIIDLDDHRLSRERRESRDRGRAIDRELRRRLALHLAGDDLSSEPPRAVGNGPLLRG